MAVSREVRNLEYALFYDHEPARFAFGEPLNIYAAGVCWMG